MLRFSKDEKLLYHERELTIHHFLGEGVR